MEWRGTSGHVEVSLGDGIAVLLLNRPDKLNALSVAMLKDVGEALRRYGAGPERAKAIVVTGAGRGFSAGDDLPATESLAEEDFEELLASFQELTRLVVGAEVPVVGALNGISVGGAAEWTLAFDARVGWSGSDYLFPENEVGLTISNASTYLLPRAIGARALPLVLGAQRISGTEAHRLGLIDQLVDSQEEVVPAALALVTRWVERGLATPFHLKLLRPSLDAIEAAIERENAVGREAWAAGTAQAGIRRFTEELEARRTSR